MPILISGTRPQLVLHLAELLTRAGHLVTLGDHLKHPVAAASRLDVGYQRIPNFTIKPQTARALLPETISSKGIKLVVPTCEEALHVGAEPHGCRVVTLADYRGLVRAGPGREPAEAEIVRPSVECLVRVTGWTGQVSFDLMQTEDGRIFVCDAKTVRFPPDRRIRFVRFGCKRSNALEAPRF